MLTKGGDFDEPLDGQWEHEPHAPARRLASRCQARRARNAAAEMTIRMASTSCISAVILTNDADANLIRHQGADIRQHGHIRKRKNRPPPTVRFAADHSQRRRALSA